MAIIAKSEESSPNGKPKKIIEFDNGDLEALKQVMEQYGFIDEQALLRYALVSLIEASDNKLYVKQNGSILAINVSEKLIRKPDANPEGENGME